MDFESVKILAETTAIRGRALLRTVLKVVGIVLVLLGAYNALVAPAMSLEVFAPYRVVGIATTETADAAYYAGDAVIVCIGAALTAFS